MSKRILLGVGGSIAAVKAPELVRTLTENKFSVDCVLTPSAEQFVSSLSLATLSGRPALSKMFGEDAFKMPHLSLAKEADAMIVAPATATLLGRMAHGLCDDMVSLVFITTKAPVLIAPAMHDTMWENPATQENVRLLKSRGVHFVGPQTGKLADGQSAVGRMTEPSEIVNALQKIL